MKKGVKSDLYKSFIINGYMDVVEVLVDEVWEINLFELFIKDGWLVGCGVVDMKGGLVGVLFVI